MKWKEKLNKLRFSADGDRTFSHVVLFFLVMVLLTLIARGTAGTRLARVTTISPTGGELSRSIRVSGTAKPVGSHFITVPAGLTVSRVNKTTLDKVSEGDVIAVIDQAALDELVIRERARLRQMELQLESQLKWSGVSARDLNAAQKDYDRAKEKYDRIQADEDSTQEDILAAMTALDEARVELEQARAEYNEQVLLKEPSARTLMLDIDTATARVNELLRVQDQEYQILAEASGLISDQPLTEETVTTGQEQIGISGIGKGFTLTFQVPKEDVDDLTRNEPRLTVTQGDLEVSIEKYSADVTTLDQSFVTFTASLRETGWTTDPITVTGDLWKEEYDVCIPMSALRQDSDGYFVYVLSTTQTLMGIDKRVSRVDVSIEQTDGRYAAVSGSLGSEQVILSSSKPLSDGDSVRVGP